MPKASTTQRGMSLIEVLVATAVMSIAIIVALTVYDASRKAFAKGENATEQQESVRIAFDTITTDLRMLGYNVNPDGNPNRPDEQLEGALDHAIILRADFDRSDPTASVIPEGTLATGVFSSVSTGNDEIVAYVLSKPDGTGPDTITFEADVREPARDGVVEPVAVNNVVLNPTSPPYTLYRVTLNNNAATYGTPAFIVRTPVIENVRNLSFVYYGDNGTFKDPGPVISEADSAKALRSGLTHVNVSLIGMTRQQDLSYSDPTDPVAPTFRKFELKGDVTPRNMGYRGIQDLNADVTPPSKPATPALIPGHCGGLIATWARNPAGEAVSQYRIYWGPSATDVSGSRNVPGSPYFLDGLTPGATYFVSIKAQDTSGNVSVPSDPASAAVTDVNTPSAPTGLTASTDQTYHVALSWSPVTTNTAALPPADPIAPRIRDLAGYRLYANSNLVVKEDVLNTSVQPPYLDTPVVACKDIDYKLTAVDTCGNESDPSPVSRGRAANARVKPVPPDDVQAYFNTPSTAKVKWRPITEDLAGQAIRVDHYEVYRSEPIDGGLDPSSAVWGSRLATTPDTYYTDSSVPPLGAGQVVYYRINGEDRCINESDYSSEAKLECVFVGDVAFVTPADGSTVSGTVPVTVAVTGGDNSYTGATFKYVGPKGNSSPISGPGPSWTDSWKASPHGHYTITATVTNNTGCKQSATIDVTAANGP